MIHRSKSLLWAIFIVLCVVWFYTLAPRTLLPTDEGRYAEMAREMVASGDWITPRLNGIKYFEDPPLQTWMTALSFKLFGLGEWQARLWAGVSGLLGIILIAVTGSRVFNQRVGFIAAAVLASSFLWSVGTHFSSLDASFSAMTTLTWCALLLAQRAQATPTEQRNWMLIGWSGMALAVLSKGLLGVALPAAVLGLYSVLTRDWMLWRRLHAKAGLLLFAAVTTPWFVLVSIRNPEFPHHFFIHEQVEHFTADLQRHAGPMYYYIPIVVLGVMPWLGILAQSLWRARREPGKGFKARRLLLAWCGIVFFFFSVSGAKLPLHMLPLFPALALLIACYLQNARNRVLLWSTLFIALVSALGLAFAPRIAALAVIPFEMPLYEAFAAWVAAAAGVGLGGSLIAALLARLRLKEWSIVALAATGLLGFQILSLGHEPLGSYAAGTIHLQKIRAELTEQTPIYTVGRYDHALPFYLGRTFILVAYADGMEFGLTQQPELWMPTVDAFVSRWTAHHAAGEKALAILSAKHFAELQRRGIPMRIVAQDPRRTIVANL